MFFIFQTLPQNNCVRKIVEKKIKQLQFDKEIKFKLHFSFLRGFQLGWHGRTNSVAVIISSVALQGFLCVGLKVCKNVRSSTSHVFYFLLLQFNRQ